MGLFDKFLNTLDDMVDNTAALAVVDFYSGNNNLL